MFGSSVHPPFSQMISEQKSTLYLQQPVTGPVPVPVLSPRKQNARLSQLNWFLN